jgi:cell division protein FtsB
MGTKNTRAAKKDVPVPVTEADLKAAEDQIEALEKENKALKGDITALRAENRQLRDESAYRKGLIEGLERVLLDDKARRELESYHYQRGLIAGLAGEGE